MKVALEAFHTLTAKEVSTWLPERVNSRDINKGSFGHVGVIAGSRGFVGAPILTAEAAARSGAGLVTLIVPKGICGAVTSQVTPVVITRGMLESTAGSFGFKSLKSVLELTTPVSCVAFGPGLGQDARVAPFVKEFLLGCERPLVVDADALDLLSQESSQGSAVILKRKYFTILTPHPAEMGRLLGISTRAVQADRMSAILSAVRKYGCHVLLKGYLTLIAGPDEKVFLNTTGNPGMATGGSGDVLSGIIAGLLAQKLSPLQATAGGAFLHGMSGDLCQSELGGSIGMLATDLIAMFPRAIAHCHRLASQNSGRSKKCIISDRSHLKLTKTGLRAL